MLNKTKFINKKLFIKILNLIKNSVFYRLLDKFNKPI